VGLARTLLYGISFVCRVGSVFLESDRERERRGT